MTPADLLKSLVPVYPPEDSAFDRSGTLSGNAQKDMVSAPKRPAVQVHACAKSPPACYPLLAHSKPFGSCAMNALCGCQSPVLDLFDVDGDHLISFYEYLLVVTFLSIPTEVRCFCPPCKPPPK